MNPTHKVTGQVSPRSGIPQTTSRSLSSQVSSSFMNPSDIDPASKSFNSLPALTTTTSSGHFQVYPPQTKPQTPQQTPQPSLVQQSTTASSSTASSSQPTALMQSPTLQSSSTYDQTFEIRGRLSQMRFELDEMKSHDYLNALDSRSKLAIISQQLQGLVTLIPEMSDKTEEEKRDKRENQQKFKLLIEDVKMLVEELEKNKGNTHEQEDEVYLKPPQSLQGYLKKQGDQGIVKKWKVRYFKQAGKRLIYTVSKEKFDQLGAINLEEIIEVVKKEKLQFDLVTPSRLYHLQAYDEIDYEHWTMTMLEWILYFKLVAIESANSSLNNSLQKREKFEEKVKLLQSKLHSNEAHLAFLVNQNKDLNQQILDIERSNREKVKEEEQKILTDIETQDRMIAELYLELQEKEAQLAKDEKETDELMLDVSKENYKLALVNAEQTILVNQIKQQQEDLTSYSAIIASLESAIEQEIERSMSTIGPKIMQNKDNKEVQELVARLNQKRSENIQLINENSNLTNEISYLTLQNNAVIQSKECMIDTIKELIAQYEQQYAELLQLIVSSQGATVEMAEEVDALKERYFSALLLQIKLQLQLIGQNVDLDYNELYEKYEFQDFRAWPIVIEKYVNSISKPSTTTASNSYKPNSI